MTFEVEEILQKLTLREKLSLLAGITPWHF
jgi:hypothetical protein